MEAPLIVLKFGSSVLADEQALPVAVQEIYRHVREGRRVVAVVSALGGTTDELLALARRTSSQPQPEALAALVATGERAAVALLTLALGEYGLAARGLSPEELALRVEGQALDAQATRLDAAALRHALKDVEIVVVPGFVGVDAEGRVALLGRGGSDLTALFLARELAAERCVLFKDVDGLYDRDPALEGARARRFASATFADAALLDGGVVQRKALEFAARNGLEFEVGACGERSTTRVGAGRSLLLPRAPRRRLRVALVGPGTVGSRVLRELERHRERFELVGVASRRLPGLALASRDWTREPQELLERDPDVLVELTGSDEALDWIRAALAEGRDVVTAHKRLLAEHGSELASLARERGCRIRGSASVGGALPALETVRLAARGGQVESFEGVLNATTNFVLSCVEEGVELGEALERARALGLAEADASRDLDGSDAAAKLALLCREAFGVELDAGDIPKVALDERLALRARDARARGRRLRVVAKAERCLGRIEAALVAEELEPRSALAGNGAENRLVVRGSGGAPLRRRAAGAGAAPTALAVLADLFDCARERSSRRNSTRNAS